MSKEKSSGMDNLIVVVCSNEEICRLDEFEAGTKIDKLESAGIFPQTESSFSFWRGGHGHQSSLGHVTVRAAGYGYVSDRVAARAAVKCWIDNDQEFPSSDEIDELFDALEE